MQPALQALAQEGMAYFDGMETGPDVRLTLPRFSLTCGGSLLDGLRARGMTLSTSLDADFSAMCADVPLYISNVIQNVRVDVDEEGTRAAAVTALAHGSRRVHAAGGAGICGNDGGSPVYLRHRRRRKRRHRLRRGRGGGCKAQNSNSARSEKNAPRAFPLCIKSRPHPIDIRIAESLTSRSFR